MRILVLLLSLGGLFSFTSGASADDEAALEKRIEAKTIQNQQIIAKKAAAGKKARLSERAASHVNAQPMAGGRRAGKASVPKKKGSVAKAKLKPTKPSHH